MRNELSQAYLKELFDYDPLTGTLYWRVAKSRRTPIGSVVGHVGRAGYIQVQVDKRPYLAHRLIYAWHHGEWPAFLDHVNGVRADCRIENLRPATHAQNNANRRKPEASATSSQWKGVRRCHRNRGWRAQIGVGGVKIHLGVFDCEADAAQAYNFAAQAYFGERAHFNEAAS